MGLVRDRYHIDAPPEFAYEIAVDAERVPDWYVNIAAVSNVSGPLDHAGASYTATFKVVGQRIDGRIDVIEAERPTLHAVTAETPGGGSATSRTRFQPADGGTDVDMQVEFTLPGGFFGSLAEKAFLEQAIGRDIRHSNRTFKAVVELEYAASHRGSRQPEPA